MIDKTVMFRNRMYVKNVVKVIEKIMACSLPLSQVNKIMPHWSYTWVAETSDKFGWAVIDQLSEMWRVGGGGGRTWRPSTVMPW